MVLVFGTTGYHAAIGVTGSPGTCLKCMGKNLVPNEGDGAKVVSVSIHRNKARLSSLEPSYCFQCDFTYLPTNRSESDSSELDSALSYESDGVA